MLNGAAKQACKRLKISWERERGRDEGGTGESERERERDGGGTGGSPFHLDSTTMNGSETLGPKFREQPQSNSCPL
jgi:hypothetical protein